MDNRKFRGGTLIFLNAYYKIDMHIFKWKVYLYL